ncbi:class I adenylate-forming enzyme family protein [Noviherbaspirillum sedimenti]|uniref:Long-chain-fatty-acid--CoA ligase n=1 Tax=Noviherbaspirillum sedimenti TaxID=2320865 RepID=A0A3A3G879_9BURK|nr:long-chain-fatty-acid--CoA ligase [Noviherbaspirillum sedimenti]RJG02959.1 long-chain-fatty-acid--CoA ligase [Noviherbaspirillum sedimenti]
MENSIGELLPASARKHGARPALIFGNRCFSYRDLDLLTNRFSNALRHLGISPGDRVSLYASNSWQWIVSYYGILKLGAVVNPLNMMLTPTEAEYAINDCQAKAVVTSSDKASSLIGCESRTNVQHIISFGGPETGLHSFDALLEQASADFTVPEIEQSTLSTIAYTSGTTGHPKGAMLSHRSVLLNTALTSVMHVRHQFDVIVSALPCAHVYGNVVMNSAFACGALLILHERFSEKEVLHSIQTHRATLFEGVPTMYMYLLNFPGLKDYDLSSLKRCTVGGQTMPRAKMEQVESEFGCPLIELWGMTEIGGLGTTQTLYGPRKHGSIGIPLPHIEAKIDMSNVGADQPDNPVIGELLIRGGITMQGYFNNPKATAEVFTEDGWLRTGDLGYVDEEGFIFLVDRAKDMIITGGFNIYPAELERIIAGHPSVAMAAVGAIKDEFKGELAKAYVVLAHGKGATEADIIEHCRACMAPYKVPRSIQFVKDLPKTSTGKIMRRELERFAGKVNE